EDRIQISAGSIAATHTFSISHSYLAQMVAFRAAPTQPPTLTNPGNRTNAEGAVISLQLSASDPNGKPLTYSASGLPSPLAVNASTGLISGTLAYSIAGSYPVTSSV